MKQLRNTTLGLVLAGGRAVRLGGVPKGNIQLLGQSLATMVAHNLAAGCSRIGLNTIPDLAPAYASMGMPLVIDDPDFIGFGPLAGVLAGLEWAISQRASILITTPCDAPFLPPTLTHDLVLGLEPETNAAIAETQERQHPLCAAWRADLAPALRAHLSQPEPKLAVRAFLDTIEVKTVTFPDEAAFLNINRPEDLKRAEEHLRTQSRF